MEARWDGWRQSIDETDRYFYAGIDKGRATNTGWCTCRRTRRLHQGSCIRLSIAVDMDLLCFNKGLKSSPMRDDHARIQSYQVRYTVKTI